MLCHIMFHGQIMCPISQSAPQPLSLLVAFIVTANSQTPRVWKRDPCATTAKCQSELNPWDVSEAGPALHDTQRSVATSQVYGGLYHQRCQVAATKKKL